ncbi:hypothetical protein B0H19DRAFT_1061764 [Mycena capillaripes]|nr:hypothetical protein B0H19DRAFT_1061764 [Mycena capillaripes]
MEEEDRKLRKPRFYYFSSIEISHRGTHAAYIPHALLTASFNALTLTCRRLQKILLPKFEAPYYPGPALGRELLLLELEDKTPLHIAVEAKNTEITSLLLDAGADPHLVQTFYEYQPLHLAAENNNLAPVTLLLDRDPTESWDMPYMMRVPRYGGAAARTRREHGASWAPWNSSRFCVAVARCGCGQTSLA